MSANLQKFLVNLASDPECLRRYAIDPAGELDGAGLSADEKAAVLSRDVRSIRRVLNASLVDHITTFPGKKKGGAKKAGGKKKGASKKAPGRKK